MFNIIKNRFKWLSGWVTMLAGLATLLLPSTALAYTNINDTTSQNDQVVYDWLNREKPAKTDTSTTAPTATTNNGSANVASSTTNDTTSPPSGQQANTIAPVYPNASKSGYVTFDSGKNLLGQLRTSTPVPTLTSKDYDYYIDRYDINMVVHEDNTYDITENLKVHYNEARHGIIRKIPTFNEVTRLDGSKTSNRAKISNIEVSSQYSVSGNGQYQSIKIGDPDETITGDKNYEIKYKYDIGRDKLANADELYFNLIGPEWDTAIREVNFTIQLPKSFDRSKLGFSSGPARSTDGSNILYTVNGNTIYGINKNFLPATTALTIRLTLPEGYYQRTMTFMEWLADNYWWLGMIAAGILLLVVVAIWFMRGRDGLVTKVISYGPPDGMNSLDVDMIYNGYPGNNGVTSLLIYLANKGYLKIHIETTPENNHTLGPIKYTTGGQESYRIEKVKDYDGKVEAERLFFDGLFAGGRTSVTESDLYDSFYRTVATVKGSETRSDLAKSLLVDNFKYQILISVIMAVTAVFIPLLGLVLLGAGFDDLMPAIMIGIFMLIFYLSMGMSFAKMGQSKTAIISFVGAVLFSSIFIIVGLYTSYNDVAGALSPLYLIMVSICCFACVIMSMFVIITAKRSEEGNRLLGQVRGFKDFLNTVEKSRIEAMVEDNPNFFYDILPYAYVLGVTDAWTKKFESMNLQAPDWYDSPTGTAFSVYSMNSFMNSTMGNISNSMTSSPSSSSSSSGGGFSGGGSGGGGGSSW